MLQNIFQVQWLHPNMADQPKNESVPEETETQKEKDIVSPSATSFFASAWSAWGKVISKLVLGSRSKC